MKKRIQQLEYMVEKLSRLHHQAAFWRLNEGVVLVFRHPDGRTGYREAAIGLPMILWTGFEVEVDWCGGGSINLVTPETECPCCGTGEGVVVELKDGTRVTYFDGRANPHAAFARAEQVWREWEGEESRSVDPHLLPN